jgi:hypothetical protein
VTAALGHDGYLYVSVQSSSKPDLLVCIKSRIKSCIKSRIKCRFTCGLTGIVSGNRAVYYVGESTTRRH